MVDKLRTSGAAMREQENDCHIPFALLAFIKVLFSNVKPKRKFDSLMTTISDLVPGCQIALLERQSDEHWRIIQTSGLTVETRFKTALPPFIEDEWYCMPNVQAEMVWRE
ncbi:sensor histidine kinase, partial